MSCFNNGIARQILVFSFAVIFMTNSVILILRTYHTIVQPKHVHTNFDRLQPYSSDDVIKNNVNNANGNNIVNNANGNNNVNNANGNNNANNANDNNIVNNANGDNNANNANGNNNANNANGNNNSSWPGQGVGYFHSKLSAMIASRSYKRLDLLAQPGQAIPPTSLYYNVPMVDKVFKVLPWTPWGRFAVTGEGSKHFATCPYNNCEMIINKAMLQQADVALVFLANISSEFKFPVNRTASQFWIAVTRESPYTVGTADYRLFNGAFNATAMHLTTSEVFFTYGYYFKRTHPLRSDIQSINVTRPKMAAWFVSHCRPPSKRDRFAEKLQKYLPVDIYGRCGPLKCSKKGDDCYKMLERDYKFYLSFENSLCTDYITEKVWNILKLNVVPVVRGGGDYKATLPPGSYINVEDFSSVKALADYLLMLSKNDVMYRQYFEWKKEFEVVSGNSLFCQVCAFLNRFSNVTNVVPRLDKVLGKKENCHPPYDLSGRF